MLFIKNSSSSFVTAAALSTLIPQALGYSGRATFYNNPGRHPGSCGESFGDGDLIAALSGDMIRGYRDPERCFRCARVSHEGKSVTVRIVDTCPGCSATSLDLSPSAFNQLAHPDRGVIPIQWDFVNCDSSVPPSSPPMVNGAQQPQSGLVSPSNSNVASPTSSPKAETKPSSQDNLAWKEFVIHRGGKTFLKLGEERQCQMRWDL